MLHLCRTRTMCAWSHRKERRSRYATGLIFFMAFCFFNFLISNFCFTYLCPLAVSQSFLGPIWSFAFFFSLTKLKLRPELRVWAVQDHLHPNAGLDLKRSHCDSAKIDSKEKIQNHLQLLSRTRCRRICSGIERPERPGLLDRVWLHRDQTSMRIQYANSNDFFVIQMNHFNCFEMIR